MKGENNKKPCCKKVQCYLENMHITLKFLGEIREGKAEEVANALGPVLFSSFPIVCRGLGAFPNEKSARVLWAGIESPGLLELHSKLSAKLLDLGFEQEKFTPHLTIARARGQSNLSPIIEKYRGAIFGECTTSSFSLKKSTLTPNGPAYEVFRSFSVKV